jgi:hypothetical protein
MCGPLNVLSSRPILAACRNSTRPARKRALPSYAKSGKAEEAVREAERAAQKAALGVVERWNAERSLLWSPTIRCAMVAGMPWLDVHCPGCRTSRAIDIRTLDRHPLASVGSLVLGLRCSFCPGSAALPVLTGLHAAAPATRWSRSMPVEFLHGRPKSTTKYAASSLATGLTCCRSFRRRKVDGTASQCRAKQRTQNARRRSTRRHRGAARGRPRVR